MTARTVAVSVGSDARRWLGVRLDVFGGPRAPLVMSVFLDALALRRRDLECKPLLSEERIEGETALGPCIAGPSWVSAS